MPACGLHRFSNAYGIWSLDSTVSFPSSGKKKKLENKSKVSIALSISKVTSQQDEPQCPAHNIPWQVWRFDALMVCACVCVYVHSVSECVCPVTF